MNTVILGLQAPLTRWCSGVTCELVSRSAGPTRELEATSAAEFIHHVLGRSLPMVATISRPGRIIRDAIDSSKARIIMSTASPATSVVDLARRSGGQPIDKLREVLDCAAALSAVPLADFCLRVAEDALLDAGPAWVSRIAKHLKLECSEALAAEINRKVRSRLTAEAKTSIMTQLEKPAAEAGREDAVAVQAALSGLNNLLKDGTCERIVATRRLFTITDTGHPPLGPIDATGRNRQLIHGPHLALPPGDWTARCVYGFSGGLVGTQLTAEVRAAGGGHEFARTSFNVTAPGRFDVNIRFAHVDPATPLDVRLHCDRAVFDGQVSVGFVEFRKNVVEPIEGDDLQDMISHAL